MSITATRDGAPHFRLDGSPVLRLIFGIGTSDAATHESRVIENAWFVEKLQFFMEV